MLCLTLYQRDLNSEIVMPIPGTLPCTIGRGKAADIHVELLGNVVSRLHARVTPQDRRWLVEDMGTRNGIFDSQGHRVESIVLTNADDKCYIAAPPNSLGAIWIKVVEGEICQCDRETTRLDLKAWTKKAAAAIDDLADLVLSNADNPD